MLIATMPKLETKPYLMIIISYLSFKRIFNATINENIFKRNNKNQYVSLSIKKYRIALCYNMHVNARVLAASKMPFYKIP